MAGPKGSPYYDIFLRQHLELVRKDDNVVIDEEGFRLLVEIRKNQSIVLSARIMGISYRKAWGLLRKIESLLGFRIVGKHRGGKDGGKTNLTNEGIELTEAYEELRKRVDSAAHDHIRDFFRRINQIPAIK